MRQEFCLYCLQPNLKHGSFSVTAWRMSNTYFVITAWNFYTTGLLMVQLKSGPEAYFEMFEVQKFWEKVNILNKLIFKINFVI